MIIGGRVIYLCHNIGDGQNDIKEDLAVFDLRNDMRSFRGYVTRYVMIRFRSLTSFFFTSFSFNSGII